MISTHKNLLEDIEKSNDSQHGSYHCLDLQSNKSFIKPFDISHYREFHQINGPFYDENDQDFTLSNLQKLSLVNKWNARSQGRWKYWL